MDQLDGCLRVTAFKCGESDNRSEKSIYFIVSKDLSGELFSEKYFKRSAEFTFLGNLRKCRIAMFLVTSPIVINVPTRGLLAAATMHAIVQWLENLNIKRNMTSMFVNKKHRYYAHKDYSKIEVFPRSSKIGPIGQNTLYSFSSSALNFQEPNFDLRMLLHYSHFIQVTNPFIIYWHLSFRHVEPCCMAGHMSHI